MDRRRYRQSRIRDRPLVGQPNAATGLPAKYVLGRNDGLRTNQAIGNGGYDLDRVPCGGTFSCTATTGAGTQLGTDIYISGPVTVTYNPNNQFLSGDDGLDRFGDFRFSSDATLSRHADAEFVEWGHLRSVRLPSVATPTACGAAWTWLN